MKSSCNLQDEIILFCSSFENSPEDRLLHRKIFYLKYGFSKLSRYGYGQSEIDFIEWEIGRGVLNNTSSYCNKGSKWWRKINMQIIYDSELAAKIYSQKLSLLNVSSSVKNWVNYLNNPSSKSWYKAHNSSVIEASLQFSLDIEREPADEKEFIKNVLIRVLFAQALVEGQTFIFGVFGKILANPIFPVVKLLVKREKLYPKTYPVLRKESNKKVNPLWLKRIKKRIQRHIYSEAEKILLQIGYENYNKQEKLKLSHLFVHKQTNK